MVCLGNVGKILLVRSIHILGISLALLIPQVIPVGSRQSELQILDFLWRNQARQVLELVDVRTSNMLDLAGTEHSLAGLMTRFKESGNVGSTSTEDVWSKVRNFVKAIKTWEKGASEH